MPIGIKDTSPFADPKIVRSINAELKEIQSDWIHWSTEPDGQGVDSKLEQHLVAQLDAHARHFLSVVDSDERLNEYKRTLRGTGFALLEYTQAEGLLSDPFGHERLDELVDNAGKNRRAKHASVPGHREFQAIAPAENIGSESKSDVISWHQRKREILFRIEMKFESRYLHWEALAIKQMLAQPPKESESREPEQADRSDGQAGVKAYKTNIGRNIDKQRKECGWSFELLSERSGIDKKLILGHIIHGKRVQVRTLKTYADTFTKELGRHITVADLEV